MKTHITHLEVEVNHLKRAPGPGLVSTTYTVHGTINELEVTLQLPGEPIDLNKVKRDIVERLSMND